MTNKQYLAIAEVVRQLRLLQTAGTISFVGEYPQDLDPGQATPSVFVRDGYKSYTPYPGNIYWCDMEILVYIYTESGLNKSDLQIKTDTHAAVLNQLMSSLTLNGKVDSLRMSEAPDELIDTKDSQLTVSTIKLNVLIRDTRV